MKAQVSIEIMISIFLSILIAFFISFMLAKTTGIYNSDIALGRSYATISNQSVSGLEGLCGCFAAR